MHWRQHSRVDEIIGALPAAPLVLLPRSTGAQICFARPWKHCGGLRDEGSCLRGFVDASGMSGISLKTAHPKTCSLLTSLPLGQSRIVSATQPLEEVMPNFAELMYRLLELQRYETERSPKLIAEDKRLIDSLLQRSLGRKPPHTVKLSHRVGKRARLRA